MAQHSADPAPSDRTTRKQHVNHLMLVLLQLNSSISILKHALRLHLAVRNYSPLMARNVARNVNSLKSPVPLSPQHNVMLIVKLERLESLEKVVLPLRNALDIFQLETDPALKNAFTSEKLSIPLLQFQRLASSAQKQKPQQLLFQAERKLSNVKRKPPMIHRHKRLA